MTTKIPTSPGQTGLPASDLIALPPGPGKALTPKRPPGAKDFASVIDQAASGSASKPPHVRTPKPASRGRREDSGAEPVRERSSTLARETRGTQVKGRHSRTDESSGTDAVSDDRREVSSTSETQADAACDQVQGDCESRQAPVREKSGKSSAAATKTEVPTEDSSSPEVEVDASAEDSETAAPATAPTNVIPFPGTANAVIIPFPLVEAQAVPPAAQTASPASAPTAAAVTSNSAATNHPVAQKSRARATETSQATTSQASSTQGAIDVSALGLKPVSGDEAGSLAPIASEASRAETSAEAERPVNNASKANVVSVAFNAAQASQLHAGISTPNVAAQTQLPGDGQEAEETARQPLDTPDSASSAKIVLLRTDAGKPAPVAATDDVAPSPSPAVEPAGISGARQEDRMESMTASKHAAAAAAAGAESAFEAPAEFTTGNRAGLREVSDLSDRTKVATDWQSGRPVSASDRPVLETPAGEAAGASVSVERISSLVLREVSLVKKYSSDSMAVVLRPDAETELFVHLSHRNGQVEATVRCERGNAHHLGALWPQLQESLAQQKVRLAPLEDSAGTRGNTNFQPPSGSLMSGGGERGTREDARPSQQQSMDDWPATPAPATAAPHVRGARGTRSRRISTSRPGWETWA